MDLEALNLNVTGQYIFTSRKIQSEFNDRDTRRDWLRSEQSIQWWLVTSDNTKVDMQGNYR